MRRTSLKDITPADSFRPSTKTLNQNIAVSGLAKDAMLSRRQSVDAQTLLFGMMGQKDEKGQDYLSQTQRENLAQFFVLDQMAKPMMRSILPAQGEPIDIGGLMSMFAAMTADTKGDTTIVDTTTAAATATGRPAATAPAATAPAAARSATTAGSADVATADLRVQVKELSEMVKRQQIMIDQLTAAASSTTTAKPQAKAESAKADTTKSDTAKRNVKRRPGPSNS